MGLRRRIRRALGVKSGGWKPEFLGDELGLRGRNLNAVQNSDFLASWETGLKAYEKSLKPLPDIRFRLHTAIWAARHGLTIPGDFVECGVFLGFLSAGICHALDFASQPKRFYLCDTYCGIPLDSAKSEDEARHIEKSNERYFDCLDEVKQNFAAYPNVELVRGLLPQSLDALNLDRIAYLSIDLNNAAAEEGCIRKLWPLLSPSAVVVLDDYGFRGFEEQHRFWDSFAAEQNTSILTNPSGQGILIKPA